MSETAFAQFRIAVEARKTHFGIGAVAEVDRLRCRVLVLAFNEHFLAGLHGQRVDQVIDLLLEAVRSVMQNLVPGRTHVRDFHVRAVFVHVGPDAEDGGISGENARSFDGLTAIRRNLNIRRTAENHFRFVFYIGRSGRFDHGPGHPFERLRSGIE